MTRFLACAIILLDASGCAARPLYAPPVTRASGSGSYGPDRASREADESTGNVRMLRELAPADQYAQADTGGDTPEVASDATSAPLLIYVAELGLSVHQVTAKQDRVEAIARELGGFLASRTDDTVVVRVPARAFDLAMAQVQELGDVISRRIEVQDVSEEFRDVETRIQTLEAMRRRVEQLLAQANDVQAALAVEQHLERITVQLEQLRGRLRFLGDRVAFSTITVHFRERAETGEPQFALPFAWLGQVGLQRLLQL